MPLLKIKTPGNTSGFNSFFIDIAGFDMVSTDMITNELFYFPEDEPYSFSFLQAGFESIFMIPGMGAFFYITLIYMALIICHLILTLL